MGADYLEKCSDGRVLRSDVTTAKSYLAESVNKFLTFNEYKILEGNGNVSRIQAGKKAIEEYDKFNKTQKIISDFDKEVKKLGK